VRESDLSGILALSRTPWIYRLGLPAIHILAIYGLFTAQPNAEVLAIGAFFYIIRGMGITVGYHRLFTHESFKTSRPVAFLLGLFGGLAGQGTMSWWVYRHRTHHRYTDKVGDPHSPRVDGFFHAHIGWLFKRTTPSLIEGETLLRREWPIELRVLDAFIPFIFFGQGVLLYFFGGWNLLVWAFFIPTVISWHLTFLVNSLCHKMGDRPFDTADDSRNNRIFAALMFGEGWHNNHHAWPKNARLGLRPLQLDFGYAFIKTLELFGLAHDLVEKSEDEIRASVKRYGRAQQAG
jgi:stearoyl-CoA desaturase (Delta-9 desaturase)